MASNTPRLYNDLAWIWSMWGDKDTEYAAYCQFIHEQISLNAKREIKTLLNIGCGGGKNLYNLKKFYIATGLDLSPQMLKLAGELNPECALIQADMRNFELTQMFDAIFIDDGLSYMLSREDLEKVFIQSYKHLQTGGVLLVTPDSTTESFIQNKTQVFHSLKDDKHPDISIVYIQNDFAPNLKSETYEATFVYLIRRKEEQTIETDRHVLGVFPLQVWYDLLIKTGYQVMEMNHTVDDEQYISFICLKP